MSFWEILLMAVGVSMDAFAVSIGKGLSVRKVKLRQVLAVGLWFGGFQALMPVIGYYLGVSFSDLVEKIDHWIAFVLLVLIGGNMIREALRKQESGAADASFAPRTMFLLAVATSIDALALGVSLAFLDAPVWSSVAVIGLTTFLFSAVGLLIGKRVGSRFHQGAEIFGGIILILLGVKILVEHLCF